MGEEAKVSEQAVNLAGERLDAAVDKVFAHCKEVLSMEAAAEAPKFFPNGIELIHVSVDIVNIVKIEVKIAGPEPK